MAPKCSLTMFATSLLILGSASAAPQDRQSGLTRARMPVLYEAYYPEQREWNPRVGLEEVRKLRELTNKLLKQEEEFGKLAAAEAERTPENIYQPRGQFVEYVFSGPVPVQTLPQVAPIVVNPKDDVQVASLTVTDAGRHKIRHHHGQAEWLLRRVSTPSGGQ